MTPLARVPIVRVRDGARHDAADTAAVESPLELRVEGQVLAVMMRTPGSDRELVAGFLLAERVIRSVDDLGAIECCTERQSIPGAAGDVVKVTMDPEHTGQALSRLASRRELLAGSSCGVCGRATLDSMQAGLEPLTSNMRMSSALLATLPTRLRSLQPIFDSTGGLHAAGIFDAAGEVLAVAEDVGRHNAVDKAIGALLLSERVPLSHAVLCVSGRTSYEIIQKAWCAGIPIVAAVSAPSSMAVTVADEAGIALAGFVRDGGLNIYTRPERIV